MTLEQQACHNEGLRLAKKQKESEWPWIELLMKMHKNKIHKCFEQSNLRNYVINTLKVNESLATCLISVSGKCLEVPALKEALKAQAFSAWTARRLVSKINNKNAAEFFEFAKHNTHAAIDFKLNPEGASTRKVRNDVKELIRQAQNLIAQQKGKHPTQDETDLIVYQEYLDRHHPKEKAKRKRTKPATGRKDVCSNKMTVQTRQKPTAEQKHAVHERDGFRCTFVDAEGRRCTEERWLHLHHIKMVQEGGGNEPENLVTLCSAHHDLCHQLSLPLERQVTWLR